MTRVVTFFLVLALTVPAAAQDDRLQAARKEGKVVWYTSLALTSAEKVAKLFERTATKDVEVAGQLVTAGQKVACLMGSANRDAAVFENADTFDVGRDPNPHVGFGLGIHFCLGAPLARLEGQIAIGTLASRMPGLELSTDRPTWRDSSALRGLTCLPLSF